jgi:hypothetical protein
MLAFRQDAPAHALPFDGCPSKLGALAVRLGEASGKLFG